MPYSNPYSNTMGAPAPIKMPKSTSSSNTSSATSSPTRPSRLSRFVEGSEVTRPEILQRTPTSNEFLFHILSEMDAHEAQRKRNNSQSSHTSNSSRESLEPPVASTNRLMPPSREGRRNINFGRTSLDGRPGREQLGSGEGDVKRLSRTVGTVKGRLRAWTVGRDRDVK